MKRLLLCLACLFTMAGAAHAQEALEFQGESFRPQAETRDGRVVWSLQDPEVKRLLDRTAARLQWSSSGLTLYVFSPIRESFWTAGGATVRVDGQEVEAPGLLGGREGQAWMEPEALLFALGLQREGQNLRPLVGAIRVTEGQGLRVGVAAPVRWQESRPAPGVLRLRFPDAAWEGGNLPLQVGDATITASKEATATVLDLRFPEYWEGEAASGLSLTEVKVQPQPQHQFPPALVALRKAEFQRAATFDEVAFLAEAPVQFFWAFDRDSRRLTVEIPGLHSPQALPELRSPESSLLQGAFSQMGTTDRPVLRFEGLLAPGAGFEFFEMEETPGSLVLRTGPQVPVQADRGSATTAGWAIGRGILVLDPGHGGSDPGCVNRWLGVCEKDVTLDVAHRLRELLEAQGWTVLMTREDDRDVSWAGSPDKVELQSRCDVANEAGADLFVSLHCNASASGAGSGTSIHWYKDEDYELARHLEFVLGDAIGVGQVGLRQDRFYVLRHTEMPAVLVEMAYLTNQREGAMLAQGDFRQRIAERLAGHLVAFMAGRYARGQGAGLQRMP